MNRKLVKLLLTGLLALAASQPAGRPALASANRQTEPPGDVLLENGYRITFDGVEYNSDNTSTWLYTVEAQPSARNLGYWALEIPACAPIHASGPGRSGPVQANPRLVISGVAWAPEDDFESGQFWVTLESLGAAGTTRVAARTGRDIAMGEIAGPTCDPSDPVDPDQQPPTLVWQEPVGQGERYDLPAGEQVELVVAADDNVGIDRVVFLRWDDAAADYITVAIDYTAPYTTTVSADDLVPAWNFITAASVDLSGNASEWQGIWLYRMEPSPTTENRSIYLPLLIK